MAIKNPEKSLSQKRWLGYSEECKGVCYDGKSYKNKDIEQKLTWSSKVESKVYIKDDILDILSSQPCFGSKITLKCYFQEDVF